MVNSIKNIKFDMSVNLGHVLAALSFLFSAVGVWYTLDKRVVVLEVNDVNNIAIHKRIEKDVDDLKRLTREDIKEMNSKLDRILGRL